ncbi:MAG: restriction endonuclease [Ancrocorticia sp.]|uniref:restriction endonuclease n=1 Tax=Ancrocorticia sp. TaxID=2593684 RepID=UPI003F912E97
MIPTLQVMDDGVVRHWREFQPQVADKAHLTDEQKTERLPSGNSLRYENRIGWAVSFMTNVGALTRPKRAHYQITDAGRQVLQRFPNGAKEHDIKRMAKEPNSQIRAYKSTSSDKKSAVTPPNDTDAAMTPIEQVQSGITRINEDVEKELLERLQSKEPAFFEQAVVELLLAMGYGGSTGGGSVTQLSNDGGIDGVIDQDILGLSRVYIQAKRYADVNSVGRPDLQAFVGALSGKADSGVFITTSTFSKNAREYASGVPTRIILIDGAFLTRLMLQFGVGVQTRETYTVAEIDEDFFE